jgi:intracellular proteinase inhibitor BsuPI/copper amine oxidase-like protein
MSVRKQVTIAAAAMAVISPARAVETVRIAYQGQVVTTSAPVVRSAGGTLVPLRATVGALGGELQWNAATKTAVVEHGGRRFEVAPGSRGARLDGRVLTGALAPRMAQGQLLVPLAVVDRLFGVRGQWLPAQRLLRFAAAGGSGRGGGQVGMKDGQPAGGVQLRLTSDRPAYPASAPVVLTLTVTNAGRAPVTLQFSSGQKYDFEVRRAGQVVWRWAAERMFTQALTSMTLAPGERKTFTETWKQVGNDGQAVPAGSYEVVATLTTMEKPQPRSAALTLRIGS